MPCDPDSYQRQVLRTESTPDVFGGTETNRLAHGILGMTGELGELAELLKKHRVYGRPMERQRILDECGDILWYLVLALDSHGFSLSQAIEGNAAKLQARYAGTFTQEKANNRNLEAEKAAIAEKAKTSCNIHADCQAAQAAARAKGVFAGCCHDDCCEECFGN